MKQLQAILTITGLVLGMCSTSHAGPTACLVGSDPIVAGDAAQITAVRALIAERCDCAAYGGASGKKHGDYVKCAVGVIGEQITALALRKECKSTVKKYYSTSTCGYDPRIEAVTCVTIKTSARGSTVSCAVKPTKKLDGTTVDKCPVASQCLRTFTHCIDAADTNGDLRIAAPGDTGTCEPEPVTMTGRCQRPGPLGTRNCDRGTVVRALRCDDPATCLHEASTSTEVANAPVDTVGRFSMVARRRAVECKNVLFKADVSGGTAYRTSADAPCPQTRDARVGEPNDVVSLDVLIDPSSEGAVRAIDAAGLENVKADDLTDLDVQTRTAPGANYAGLDDAAAADTAETVAVDLFSVQPSLVVTSTSGQYVYVRSGPDKALSVLRRDASSGALTFVQSFRDDTDGIDGLKGQGGIAASPDGTSVYATGYSEGKVAAFHVDGTTGRLSFVEVETNGIGGVSGMGSPNAVTVSPDGSHVYVAGGSGGIAVFSRNVATSGLTFLQSLSNGVGGVSGLSGASAIAVSPDGAKVYVTATESTLVTFTRNPATGLLTFVEVLRDGVGGVDGLSAAWALAVSGDGSRIYVAAAGEGAVSVFAPNSLTGGLSFIEAKFNGGGIQGLTFADAIAVSPDGEHVYVGGEGDGHIAIFQRNVGTGGLSYVGALNRDEARGLAISPDGMHLYVAALLYKSIPIFNRDDATGLLTANGEGRAYLRRSALRGASHVVVSADAAHVYASAHNDDSVVGFRRNTQTGKLFLVDSRRAGAGGISGLQQPNGVALSPDDLHLYAASGYVGEVAAFARDIDSGALSLSQQINNGTISALATANKVLVSPDGAHVYVGTHSGSPTVVVFSRDLTTGVLTWVQNVSGQPGLSGVSGLCFSPDGAHLYVTNSGNSSQTVVFQRDSMSGQLTWVQSTTSRGFDVAITSNGAFVYVASDALQVFQRNPATGMLTLVQQQTYLNGNSGSPMAATTVAISPDDQHVYAASQQNAALSVFSRNLTTGLLSHVELHFDGINGVDGLEGGLHAAVSGDGKNVYVSSFDDDAIAIFARDATTGAVTFVQSKR